MQGTVNNEDAAAADTNTNREISDFKLEEDMQAKIDTEVLPTDESKISTKPRAETLVNSAQKTETIKDDDIDDESEPQIE